MEKWNYIKNFNFLLFWFGWGWKRGMMKKVRSYKFMYVFLLKNDAQFKPKGINNQKKTSIT